MTPLGLLTKWYSGPGAVWVATQAGGLLYVVFWVFAVLAVAPRLPPLRVSVWVLGVTSTLECLQLWQPEFLQGPRATFLGHALIGSTFEWSDFPYYVAGAALAWAGATILGLGPEKRFS